ncbi:MAG: PBP1A family penicillin-binding protein [Deltaproteobacteria bacterium]|nr:PBP1A family penicillin-binding protein [Deltaproteobacteria bacterium]
MSVLSKTIKGMTIIAIAGIITGLIVFGGVYYYFSKDLPRITRLDDYRPSVVTSFYSDENIKIGEFYKERRIVIPLSKIPEQLKNAFIAAEDARFYHHGGIDFFGIIRAFFKNLEAGAIVQGGSTITQQVAKSFFLSSERSYTRKIKEAILAYRIDAHFSKDEIIYLYLNQIYLGYGAYGVEAAAENYFGKKAGDLNLAECAVLAGLPRAPSRYSPYLYPQRAKERQIYVLNRMVAEGFIDNLEASEAINTPIDVKSRKNWFSENVPYYAEEVRREIENKYGSNALYSEGLSVYTNVNIEMQKEARKSIKEGLNALDKREGYRGPLKHIKKEEIETFILSMKSLEDKDVIHKGMITKGIVTGIDDKKGKVYVTIGKGEGIISVKDMRWARKPDPEIPYGRVFIKRPGDVLNTGDLILVRLKKWDEKRKIWELSLEQIPEAQSALICIETGTGNIKAMVGGRDYLKSQFNRAVQSRRQPGSAFKPIIYAAALDKGYTPATVIADTPIVFNDKEHDFTWKPDNYDNTFHGFTLFREGLIHSMNVITVKILRDIGIDYVIKYTRSLGITAHLDRDLSLALGSSGMSLMEVVRAYSVFANQGYMDTPSFIKRIEDRDGNVIYENTTAPKRVMEKGTAYIITHLLEEVVKEGTGWRVKALKRPVAGKTGTTNNLHDAWFVGFTPRYVTGAWVGYDHEKSLGSKETGSRAASPIWLEFMQNVLRDKPVRVFPVPDNVVFAKIDAKTGLLPVSESEKIIFECFKEGTVPTEHTRRPDEIKDTEDFFKKGM